MAVEYSFSDEGQLMVQVTDDAKGAVERIVADKEMRVIPAGSLLTVSTGEYSEYTVHGVFRAIERVDAYALRAEWLETNPKEAEANNFDEYKFLAWVARRGLIEAVDAFEWHLSEYGNAEAMDVLDCKYEEHDG